MNVSMRLWSKLDGNQGPRRLAILLAGLLLTHGALAQDRVTFLDRADLPVERTGDIVTYDSRELRLKLPAGTIRRVAASRVVSVTYEPSEAQRAAEAHVRDREFAAAVALFGNAYRLERREWVKQELAARSIVCWTYLGEIDRAANTFRALVQADPDTRFRHVIPLAWRPQEPPRAFVATATDWLSDPRMPAAARLIAGSWLLSGLSRSQAERVLVELADNRQADWVGALARAQRWRINVATVEASDVERWQQQWDALPQELRAGPAFVLAQAYERLGQIDSAVLAYLQVAWWEPPRWDLADQALWSAGQLLHSADRHAEATRVWAELLARFPKSPHAAQIQEALRTSRAAGRQPGEGRTRNSK